MAIGVKRAYEKYTKKDGSHILVDRLWPRGVTKTKAHITYWAKELAPTTGLRRWFHADPENRFRDFEKKYASELKNKRSEIKKILQQYGRSLTFVTAAKDVEHSHVPTLITFLNKS